MSNMCPYCSEPDSHGICAGIHYAFPDFNISADYSKGKLTIYTPDGDECFINFSYCPVCGNKLEATDENS